MGKLQAYQFSALEGTTHAVFTRLGGTSQAPWQSLNMGQAVGDSPTDVAANFELACRALRINSRKTVACHLVHGNQVMVAEEWPTGHALGQADALITQTPDLFLTMRFADCTPLLIYDRVKQSIGLAHAGWRGTIKNIMRSVIEAMAARFGSRPDDMVVVIGPSIGPCCYQVGEEVMNIAGQTLGNPEPFFRKTETGLYFDMWKTNGYQAKEAGLENVVVSGLCTACRTNEFFSHRAEKGKTGRFGVFFGIPDRDM